MVQAPREHAIAYRPDIDGLRALAVLAVIGFHAGVQGFGGGFVGVDVFFVISGYLISGIIIRSIERGTFTFRDFYARRINRIFPALLVVLASTLILGALLLFRSEFASLGKHVAAGAVFLSNGALIKETGYFDVAAERKPLLHLWSLAIEEQFYLFWPLFLAASWRIRKRFVWPAILLALGSLALAIFFSRGQHAQTSFYLPFTRLWELIAGFVMFYVTLVRTGKSNLKWADVNAWLGAAMLCASVFLLSRGMSWPSALTILPVAATILLLSAGQDAWFNRVILSNSAVVRIGLVSYPLYLWHWPLLAFVRFIYPTKTSVFALGAAIALSFVLAILTYKFVEFPIRSRVTGRGRRALVLCALLALVGATGVAAWTGRIPVRLDGDRIRAAQEAMDDWTYPGGGFTGPHGSLRENVIGGGRDTVLFAGDSHMEQYWPRVDSLVRASRSAPSAIFTTVGGCPALPLVTRVDLPQCDKFYTTILQRAQSPGIKTVVLNSYWDQIFRRKIIYQLGDASKTPLTLDAAVTDTALSQFSHDIAALVAAGKKVFVILTVPMSSRDEVSPATWLPNRIHPVSDSVIPAFVDRRLVVDEMLPALSRIREAATRGGAVVLDPVPHMCSVRGCIRLDSVGRPLYKDGGHLRAMASRERAVWIDETLK